MNRTYVFLTGGLGNQLFQLAAGLSRNSQQVVFDCGLGIPRLNKDGAPDILDFQLPASAQFKFSGKPNKVFSKFSGYVLRQGLVPPGKEKIFGLPSLILLLLGKLLFFRFGQQVKVVQARDNGFFVMTEEPRNEYLVGYFQSYRWPDLPNVAKQLNSLSLVNPSEQLISFIQENSTVQSVMVHVRLGDYKNQDNFGIPSPNYYRQALQEIGESRLIEKILLFSNEPKLAVKYIPTEYQNLISVVPDFNGSAAETLEAMRHARNYIIGNSSLSWWGAKLSYSQCIKVIAPRPWFKESPEPNELIPPEWSRIDAFPKS
jgi:hypothetical protein